MATTNVQSGLVFFFLLSFYKEGLNFKRSPGGIMQKKCAEWFGLFLLIFFIKRP